MVKGDAVAETAADSSQEDEAVTVPSNSVERRLALLPCSGRGADPRSRRPRRGVEQFPRSRGSEKIMMGLFSRVQRCGTAPPRRAALSAWEARSGPSPRPQRASGRCPGRGMWREASGKSRAREFPPPAEGWVGGWGSAAC